MAHWLDNAPQQLQIGHAFGNGGDHHWVQDWHSRTGAERWQAAMHAVQPAMTAAEIFRTRAAAEV